MGVRVAAGLLVAGCNFLRAVEEVPGPALPAGTRECINIPAPTCRSIIAGRERAEAARDVVAFSVRCTAADCTPASGQATATLDWSDGTSETFGTAWSSLVEPLAPLEPDPPGTWRPT